MRVVTRLMPIAALTILFGCGDPVGTAQTGIPAFNAGGDQGASHGVPLIEVGGDGSGTVSVTPTAEGAGFTAQITVNVRGLSSNTTYLVQRSPDFPVPPWTTDGICDRAAGNFPAGVTGSVWIPFPTPNPGPPVTITTSEGGAGAVSFEFDLPAAAELAFDVMFRVVDNTAAPTRELRSPCFMVTPK